MGILGTGVYLDKDGCLHPHTQHYRKEYYYLRALNLLDSDAYDNTLSEPIAFPSNVNGGTGMVGFSTETNYMLTVKNNAVPPMVPDL